MRAQASATIKCLLKGLREAGTSAPSFPPRKALSVGGSRPCKGKQRQESWVVTSRAKGQQAAPKEVVSAQAQKSTHTATEATSATSMEQEAKDLSNHLKDSCKWGFSRLVSLLDPSPCRPASLTGLACTGYDKLIAHLKSLSLGTQGWKMSFLPRSHSLLGQPACFSLAL